MESNKQKRWAVKQVVIIFLSICALSTHLFATTVVMQDELQVKVDKDGNAVLVWEEDTGTSVHAIMGSTLDYNASNWTTPTLISTPGQDSRFPVLAMNEDGDSIVIWLVNDPVLSISKLYASQLVSGTWTTPVQLSTNIENVMRPYHLEFVYDHATALWHSFVIPIGKYQLFSRRVKFSHSWGSIHQATPP